MHELPRRLLQERAHRFAKQPPLSLLFSRRQGNPPVWQSRSLFGSLTWGPLTRKGEKRSLLLLAMMASADAVLFATGKNYFSVAFSLLSN
jgi:hypothetical protein